MALATNGTPGEIYLNGDLHGSNDPLAPELTPTGVLTGSYEFPHIAVDVKGRVLWLENITSLTTPCASGSVCGVIKIDENALNVSAAGILDLPIATANTLGTIQPSTNISISGNTISSTVGIATTSALGRIRIGSNLNIDSNGILNNGNNAGNALTGTVQIGDNINVSSGVISANLGTNTALGIVRSGNTNNITITSGDVNIGADVRLISSTQSYSAAQSGNTMVLSNVSGNITLDANLHTMFDITASGNIIIDGIVNLKAGQQVDILIRLRPLISSYNLTLNPTFFKVSGNTIAGHTTIISCTQITNGGNEFAYTIVQPYFT